MHSQRPTDNTLYTDDPRTDARPTAAQGSETAYRTSVDTSRPEMLATPRESKPGIMTTEFWVMVAMVIATLVATYADFDSLARVDGWRFAAFIVAAYIVSRGLAKIGTADRKVQHRR